MQRRILPVLAALTIAALVLATPASATYLSSGSGTNVFSVYHYPANPTWETYMDHARICWNATSTTTGTSISQTSSSSAIKKIQAGSWSTTWTGLYSPSGSRASRTFLIQLNADRIAWIRETYPGSVSFGTWAAWTACHEMGHALSLADNPSGYTSLTSIMKYPVSWATTLYSTPRTHDINEVASYY